MTLHTQPQFRGTLQSAVHYLRIIPASASQASSGRSSAQDYSRKVRSLLDTLSPVHACEHPQLYSTTPIATAKTPT